MAMSRPVVVVATGAWLLLAPGCVIDRSDLGPSGTDASVPTPDAFVPPGLDAARPPPDAYAPPGVDAWAPDAWSAPIDAHILPSIDAYAPPPLDAYAPPPLDAYTPPPPDAYTPPADAWSAPDSGCNGRDDDGDGLRDPCDPWPCGAMMPSITEPVAAESIAISGVRVDGAAPVQVVRAGATPVVTFDFAIDDVGCGGCRDQIEIGTAPGGRLECVYDANPPGSGATGSASVTLPPLTTATPQRIDVRFNLSQDYGCDRHVGWWGGEPGAAQSFAVLCVVP